MKSISLIVLMLPFVAFAQVYKCKDSNGELVFSDKSCGDDAQLIELNTQDTGVSFAKGDIVCASGVSASVRNIHYPSLTDPEEAVRQAEASLTSHHYRKAIEKVDPENGRPKQVSKVKATAFRASEVPGFNSGVVVHAEVCK